MEEKSGIYKISCGDCEKIYIGQTKRLVTTRFQEHVKEATKTKKSGDTNFKSNVAKHLVEENHNEKGVSLEVIKDVNRINKLDVIESLYIFKSNKDILLNTDSGNGYTWLFNLIP